ncbi:NADH:flavin oxidoreductase [Paenibacillus sp. GCM10012307]|uniref:NADH:flavin oxidoreductase n=1 Tax=Paenibacillus roseus TaxID=2798579 RepID=A0A934J479_9BACL|nr:NADH:flavin oxidoreductase [Paenibacillus roseus]MBJ6360110.1 NADH:flavin oxidoreductase [Paenibacillus roseus]
MTINSTVQAVHSLFQPLTTEKISVKNRIVMAPMTRLFSPGGVPGADVAAYYRRRAANSTGLIITEGTTINHPAASNHANIPTFHGEAALNGWAQVVKEVHEAGGKIIPQIWHVGTARKQGDPVSNPEVLPVGPSGLNVKGDETGKALTEAEIADIVQAFAQAAADAKRIGFDGVALHGAHGYLIDQFFWEVTNKRTDRYGGDIAGRTQFAVEIVEAIRKAVGPDFPIVLRISQFKQEAYAAKLANNPEELEQFLAPLVKAGVDIFDCSARRFWEPEFEGSPLSFAGWVKKLSGKPVITVGSVGLNVDMTGQHTEDSKIETLIEKLDNQEFDLVAVGRALLADPEWVEKIRTGRDEETLPYTRESVATLY